MNLTEKTLEEQTVFQGKIFQVKRDKVLLPNGHQSVREVVEHPGGVMVAPLTKDDTLLFVRQYRYAFRDVILELPAGKLEPGENPYDAGLRELREEVGARAEKVVSLGCIYPTVGYCSEVIHLYCAAGLQMGEPEPDGDEFLELCEIPFDQAVEMVLNHEIPDAKSAVAILKLQILRQSGRI